VRGPFLFLHVNLLDNRSEFSAPLENTPAEGGRRLRGGGVWGHGHCQHHRLCQRGHRPHIDLHWPHPAWLTAQAVRYLLFGEGETGLMVYTILLRYWDWTLQEDVRPLIFLMSD
jgi:hypothetical protein